LHLRGFSRCPGCAAARAGGRGQSASTDFDKAKAEAQRGVLLQVLRDSASADLNVVPGDQQEEAAGGEVALHRVHEASLVEKAMACGNVVEQGVLVLAKAECEDSLETGIIPARKILDIVEDLPDQLALDLKRMLRHCGFASLLSVPDEGDLWKVSPHRMHLTSVVPHTDFRGEEMFIGRVLVHGDPAWVDCVRLAQGLAEDPRRGRGVPLKAKGKTGGSAAGR